VQSNINQILETEKDAFRLVSSEQKKKSDGANIILSVGPGTITKGDEAEGIGIHH
jgi:hypothetical protein